MDKSAALDIDMERYARHLALPDFSVFAQKRLKEAHVLMVGAGGLGAAALPYLAGAGIGKISICDDDKISVSNLHRQTIYKTCDAGQSKAKIAADYAMMLNPDCAIVALDQRMQVPHDFKGVNFDLIFDGSDNFATKSLLNALSIENKTPLVSASVNQYYGQCGIFNGGYADTPCYHCLFPELPQEARNCNEAGVLGTAAGLSGIYQAHLTLLFLAGLEGANPGMFLNFDLKSHRLQNMYVYKNAECPHCAHSGEEWNKSNNKGKADMVEIISYDDLQNKDHIIVDVRTDGEVAQDPIEGALHIEVSEIPARHEELPKDKLLAFVCAGNVRSVQAVEYLAALGYKNIIVLDKFSL